MLLTTKEIAQKWGVSVTWVTILCKKGRIKGVVRDGNRWYIPEDAKKPADRRTNKEAPGKKRFRFVDLFAGIGGFHQAMRYLGGECVMAAEINEECRKTYQLNYHTQEKEIRRDVTEIDPLTIAPFDVLCAGFPCQPFSKAGAQKGFQDKKRGNLFYTIMNILDAHPEVKFIILENVRNLADKTENWGIITSELMQRNFYITEEPLILSPSDFGIPQIRERVYILGIRKDIRNEKILSNGFIHKTDLHLEKYLRKCKMGDAWTILEENVDDSYMISEEQEKMIFAWDEFRIGTGIKVIGFPIWIDSFGVEIDDDQAVFQAQGYLFHIIFDMSDPTMDWLLVEADGENEYTLSINMRHSFFKPLIEKREFMPIMMRMSIALVLAEIESMTVSPDGRIEPSAIRLKMNEILESVRKGDE